MNYQTSSRAALTALSLSAMTVFAGVDPDSLPAGATPTGAVSGTTVVVGESSKSRERALSVYVSDKLVNLEFKQGDDRSNISEARIGAAFLLSEERDNIFSGNYMIDMRSALVPDFRFSVGARGYVALLGQENQDVFGLGPGLEAQYILPNDRVPLDITAAFFYSPDVLAFGQADRIIDWNVDIGLQARDNLRLFYGFRYLEFDTRPGDRKVDQKFHVGVQWAID